MQDQDTDFEQQTDSIELEWNRPFYTLKGKPFTPIVSEDPTPHSSYFNTKTIYLDGQIKADLTWQQAHQEATEAIQSGYYLFWDLNIGLMEHLPFALTHQTQYLSLTLSLEHFRDFLWKEFKEKTIGISLYRGSVDFSLGFSWDAHQKENLKKWIHSIFKEEATFNEEIHINISSFSNLTPEDLWQTKEGKQLVRLFCRDVSMEYISLLASRLPDSLPIYLFLDMGHFANHPLFQMQLLQPARFESVNLALKETFLPFQAWGWESHTTLLGYSGHEILPLSLQKEASIGICIPSLLMVRPSQFQGIEQAIKDLMERSIPFRIIAEEHLITDWDGLDYLIYAPTGLSGQGKRKLQGFCAAGGTVVSTLSPMGFEYEIPYDTFYETHLSKSIQNG